MEERKISNSAITDCVTCGYAELTEAVPTCRHWVP